MLQPQVTSGTWRRWLVRSSLVYGACGAAVAAIAATQLLATATASAPATTTIVTAIPIAMPTITVVNAEPPAEPGPPAPPDPDPPPPVIHYTCPHDVSLLGVPYAGPAKTSTTALDGAATSTDGCTLAAWQGTELHVSWDGGQTFQQLDVEGAIDQLAISGDRITLLTGDALGILRAHGELAMHLLGDARPLGPPERRELFAAGPWTVVTTTATDPDKLGSPALAAVTEDDGETWIYVQSQAPITELAADGHLALDVVTPTAAADGMSDPPEQTARWVFDLRHAGWRHTGTQPGNVIAHADDWAYALVPDKFWGCGRSQRLVALHGATRVDMIGDLRDGPEGTALVAAHGTAYVLDSDDAGTVVRRFAGTRSTRVAAPDGLAPRGVDASGALIATRGSQLLRWSPLGGWRVLFTTAAVSDAD